MSQRSEAEPANRARAPIQNESGTPHPDTPTPLLGQLTPSQFMRRYWQKKPLLIRQAIPDIAPPLSRDALSELAADYDTESRLITHFRNRWQLEQGPFEDSALPSVSKHE